MKRCYLLAFSLIMFFSCSTVNNKFDTYKNDENSGIYDLTVLKGGSYPNIKNDYPFTEVELQILQSTDGLELEANIEVAHYFKYFLRDRRELLELWIDNSRDTIPFIKQEFQKNNLPVDLIYLPYLESGYNPMAYSRVGAGGVWQFMPRTARSYGLQINWWIDERRSPQLATPYAIKHLSYLNKKFDSWYTALAAYNAGEGRISRAMSRVEIYDYFELIKTDVLPKETRRYVPQYLAIIKIMKNLETLGFKPIDWSRTDNITSVTIPGGTDMFLFCQNIGITWNEFKTINPAFRRQVNDPSRKSIIYIPKNKSDIAKNYIKNSKSITRNGYQYYRIQKGDTWWLLSNLTQTPIESLKRLNSITSNRMKTGQRVLLPTLIKAKPVTQNKISSGKLKTHIVKSGDTISSISIRYNIKLSSLYKTNSLNSYSILKVGQVIKLPGYPIKPKKTEKSINSVKTTKHRSKVQKHRVVYGDTLSGISYKYDIDLRTLMRANGIKNASSIKVGDTLTIPRDNNMYTVQNGDSIWLIAQKTKIPYKKLLSLNNLNSKSRLRVGETIRLY